MNKHHDIREFNKYGLETYLRDYEFPNLEFLLKAAIDSLLDNLKKAENEYDEVVKNNTNKESSNYYFYTEEIFSIQERLLSIYEMIIVNDYKEFELILKRLLKASLNIDEKNFRSFDNVKYLVKSKGIVFAEIKNYNDINDLRKINNYIKHSNLNKIPDKLKQIPEFRKIEQIEYVELMKFHRRIEKLRYNFILDLKHKIYLYLYEYDDERINNIALRMSKVMDTKHVDLLIKKLIELK